MVAESTPKVLLRKTPRVKTSSIALLQCYIERTVDKETGIRNKKLCEYNYHVMERIIVALQHRELCLD